VGNNITAPKEWANPTPAGLVGLAIACFGFFAILTGKVEHGALPLFGCFLIGGFVVQLVVALVDLKQGNVAGGNTFLFFCAYFMLASGMEMFLKYFVPGIDPRIDGWCWLVLSITIILWTPAFYKTPAILFVLVVGVDIALPFVVVTDLKILSPEVSKMTASIAGHTLLVCGIIGIYLAAALVVNGTYGRKIFPNPAPLYKGK
jgi:succinate-acetate transporter protein